MAGLARNVLAQSLGQGLTPALDTNQGGVRRWQQAGGLARHRLQDVIEFIALVQAQPLTCQ
ncbi:hypothetical protein D3C80_2113650 [compost metagenome]